VTGKIKTKEELNNTSNAIVIITWKPDLGRDHFPELTDFIIMTIRIGKPALTKLFNAQ